MTYILDGKEMTGRKKMHSYLKEHLSFPDYYGNNMDAFWDCMTERRPGDVVIINAEAADQRAIMSLIRVLLRLCKYCPGWSLKVESKTEQ